MGDVGIYTAIGGDEPGLIATSSISSSAKRGSPPCELSRPSTTFGDPRAGVASAAGVASEEAEAKEESISALCGVIPSTGTFSLDGICASTNTALACSLLGPRCSDCGAGSSWTLPVSDGRIIDCGLRCAYSNARAGNCAYASRMPFSMPRSTVPEMPGSLDTLIRTFAHTMHSESEMGTAHCCALIEILSEKTGRMVSRSIACASSNTWVRHDDLTTKAKSGSFNIPRKALGTGFSRKVRRTYKRYGAPAFTGYRVGACGPCPRAKSSIAV
mmetsp:Transcript_15011/g.45829  ORF Transcript_15011/g.45829 Transcript_15011/m.45829 type:complete len:272 (-) Transcript_15011:242-1057(-)